MTWEEYSRILLEKCKTNHTPFHACFELTPFCNFRCNMCYIRLTPEQAASQGEQLSTQQWIHLAEETKKMGVLSLEVTGGEAMTRNDFPEIYQAFHELGFIINLRTNGYLLSGERLELLLKNKPHRVSVTLYGASDATYQKVCGVDDGFTVVKRNIISLCDAGLIPHLSMMVTKDNDADRKELSEWAEKNYLKIIPHGGMITPIRGAKRSVDALRIDYSDEECEITSDMEFLPHSISNKERYMDPFWMCRAFGVTFCISWDGRMTLCNTMTAVWKDPTAHGLSNAYYELYHDLGMLKRPEKCNSCEYIDYCAICPSQFLSSTGDPESTNEELCRRARRRFKRNLLKAKTV